MASVSGGQLILSSRKGKIRHPTSAADYGTAARKLFEYGAFHRGLSLSESSAHDRYCERVKDFIVKDDYPISRAILFDEEFRLQHHDGKRDCTDCAADLRDKYLAGPSAKEAKKKLAELQAQLAKLSRGLDPLPPTKKPKNACNQGGKHGLCP